MYKIVRLHPKKITTQQRKTLDKLIFPAYQSPYQPPLQLDPAAHEQISFAAYAGAQPVGLCIAVPQEQSLNWEIASLFVLEPYQLQGIEEQLLNALENAVKGEMAGCISMVYKLADSVLLDPLLAKQGWEGKRPYALSCYYEDIQKFHPRWFDRAYTTPKDFEIFLWKDLKDEEKQHLKAKCATPLVPISVNPFQGDGSFEPGSSVGLRFRGEVVGWVITRLLPPSTLDYFCFFIAHDLQGKGMIMLLLIKAIQLQQQGSIKSAYFFVNMIHSHKRWLLTVRKRLIPSATKVTLYQEAWKNLA